MLRQEIVYIIEDSPALSAINISIYEDGNMFLTTTFVSNPKFNQYDWSTNNKEAFYEVRETLDDLQKPVCDFLRHINRLSPLGDKMLKRILTDLNIPIPKADDFKIIFSTTAALPDSSCIYGKTCYNSLNTGRIIE